MKVLLIALVVMVLLSATQAFAGANAGHKVAIHVLSHASRTCSKGLPSISSCHDIETTYSDSGDIDVFPVIYELEEVTGPNTG